MEWNKKRLFVMFLFLMVFSLLFLMFVYEVPSNFRYFFQSNRQAGMPVIRGRDKPGKKDMLNNEAQNSEDAQGDVILDEPISGGGKLQGKAMTNVEWPLNHKEKKKLEKKKRRKLKKLREKWKKKQKNGTKSSQTGAKSFNISENSSTSDVSESIEVGEEEQRFPNAIIIGSKKAGTRALLQHLKIHPKIITCGKEVHFFDRFYDNGLGWYKEKMPYSYPDEIVIEKTPAYFVTESAPSRIYELCKNFSLDIKFIVILRDPVERAISDYAQSLTRQKKWQAPKKKKYRHSTFESKVFTRFGKEVDETSSLISIGHYAKHLARWLQYFDIKKFLFVSGETFVKEPWKELEAVQNFLNISVSIKKEDFWYNSTKKFFCIKWSDKSHKKSCLGDSKGRKHPKIDLRTIRVLRKYFKPLNERFYQMTGRNFGWPTS